MHAAAVYEVVIVRQHPLRRWASATASLVAGAVTLGTWAPAPDAERAEIRRRGDGSLVRVVDNVGVDLGLDRVREVHADVDVLDEDAFAAKWLAG